MLLATCLTISKNDNLKIFNSKDCYCECHNLAYFIQLFMNKKIFSEKVTPSFDIANIDLTVSSRIKLHQVWN